MASLGPVQYFWDTLPHTLFPTADVFIKKHQEFYGLSKPEASNEVYQVMRTMQHMLLMNPRFMLPGIGVIGLARGARKGLTLSTASLWWTPGLMNVLAAAPGWEAAPLNKFLDLQLIHKANEIIAKIKKGSRSILSPEQFYQASDFGLPDEIPSDTKMRYYQDLETDYDKRFRENDDAICRRNKTKVGRIEQLEEQVRELGGDPDDSL